MKTRFVSLSLISFTLIVILILFGHVPGVAAAEPGSAAVAMCASTSLETPLGDAIAASFMITRHAYIPMVWWSSQDELNCVTGETYGSFPTGGGYDGIPAAQHPDKNLAMRGYVLTGGSLGYSSLGLRIMAHDSSAPQLPYLFSPPYVPAQGSTNVFVHNYQVYSWPWPGKGPLITDPPVTMVGIGTSMGTILRLPIRLNGDHPVAEYPSGTKYYGTVIYADATRITIVYTSRDSIVTQSGSGYGIHAENICVDPNLLALYNQLNAAGRASLPGLRYNQPFGKASSSEVDVAMRDSGQFMDPRSYVDWWQP